MEPIEYKVTIATGSTGPSEDLKDDCVQCRIVGTMGQSLWINLFANFRRNTVDVFHFTGTEIGELTEAVLRLKNSRNIISQFIDAIHVQVKSPGQTQVKKQLFALIDEERLSLSDGQQLIYLPGALYRFEVHSLTDRVAKAGNSEPVIIELFAVQSENTSGPIKLHSSIIREEMLTAGRDIFISPGRAINRFDQGMIINDAESVDGQWQIDKLSIHSCVDIVDGACLWRHGRTFHIRDIVGNEKILTSPVRRDSNKLVVGDQSQIAREKRRAFFGIQEAIKEDSFDDDDEPGHKEYDTLSESSMPEMESMAGPNSVHSKIPDLPSDVKMKSWVISSEEQNNALQVPENVSGKVF